MQKMLLVDQEKCTGCRACEAVCSAKHEGACNPMRSRVYVVKREWEGFMMPFMCQQCLDAPCVAACPMKALSRKEELGDVKLNYDRCIGCKLCITVCPFGGMGFDPIGKKVLMCDFFNPFLIDILDDLLDICRKRVPFLLIHDHEHGRGISAGIVFGGIFEHLSKSKAFEGFIWTDDTFHNTSRQRIIGFSNSQPTGSPPRRSTTFALRPWLRIFSPLSSSSLDTGVRLV